jgi:hypothetical protein
MKICGVAAGKVCTGNVENVKGFYTNDLLLPVVPQWAPGI